MDKLKDNSQALPAGFDNHVSHVFVTWPKGAIHE